MTQDPLYPECQISEQDSQRMNNDAPSSRKCWGTQYFKKFTYDHARSIYVMHSNEWESVSTYPRRPKAEVFSNAVDVVERLRVLTDPSTECMAPPRSAHVQLGDVPQTLNPAEVEGEFLQHDNMMTVMMKLSTQGFA